MNRNFVFDNVNDALPALLDSLLVEGDEVGSRLGERTMELTAVGITLTKPWQRELVLPDRKANIAAQIAETMWVLSGRNDIEWLSQYLPRASDFSDDGKTWRAGYGPRLRAWRASGDGADSIDQLEYVITTLMGSPGSRQAVATIWDPAVDTTMGSDIACNNWLHFLARKGKLDLLVGIRSNDSMWGWSGINAFEWSALLEMVAAIIGHEVGSLHFAVGSFHLYDRHWDKARRLSQTEGNFLYTDSPRFNALGIDDMHAFDEMCREWFDAEAEIRNGNIHANESVEMFPEPMLQSWLRVLQWWWTGEHDYLIPLRNTRLYEACKVGVQPKLRTANNVMCACGREKLLGDARVEIGGISHGLTPCYAVSSFVQFVDELHTAKHNAYGDSWKRRGEYMIMANIARKIDRLEGGADTPDETQTDTAIDLLVYLAKYDSWLNGGPGDPNAVRNRLLSLEAWHETHPHSDWEPKQLVELFSFYETITAHDQKRNAIGVMMEGAYCLAHNRWSP